MKKRLIYRLSSLGDVVISLAALDPPFSGETHWVVSRELAPLLEKEKQIQRVIAFDRKNSSLSEWLRFNREIFIQGKYDEVLDLHRTWRTLAARWALTLWGLKPAVWRTISKERVRRLGYVLFKRSWPQFLRPQGLRKQIRGFEKDWSPHGATKERPSLRTAENKKIGLAPSSAWVGKEWPAENFVQLAQRLHPHHDLVLLGTLQDINASRFLHLAQAQGLRIESWLGQHALADLADQLAQLDVVVSCDSGLAHLAERAGTPVVTIYGPTRSDFGFGPTLPASIPVESRLWCSPCSKDGSMCFRPVERYKCLKIVTVTEVEESVREVLRG